MFPENEIGSRPSGLFRVLLLRVVAQDILGRAARQRSSGAAEQRSSGAAGQRGSGAAEQRGSGAVEQRSSGAVAKCSCVGQRDGAKLRRSIDSHVVDYEA